MDTILLIGLSLFLCSAAVIFVTMRSASISDLRRKPMRSRKLFPLKAKTKQKAKNVDISPLADRRKLEDHARSIEGTVFFF